MIENMRHILSFQTIIKLIAHIPYSIYHAIIALLILVGTICNYGCSDPLPMFWILVVGFVAIVYSDLYSIKQTHEFYEQMETVMSGDEVLFLARSNLEKKMYSNKNWLIVLILPASIIPVVIYIIRCPLGLPIKIFAYTALYIILALCFIGYSQYVSLIMMAHACAKGASQITRYDKNRPHKTEWIDKLAALTNKQSNLFFFAGAGFIALLYLITFTEYYAVQLDDISIKIIVFYLWGIIATAIVIMFPIFSLCSYISIKNLITKLVEKEINKCTCIQNATGRKKNRRQQQHMELFQAFNQVKIFMLEKTPVYPQKPLIAYAFSYIIAAINFAATVQAAISLVEYIP